jgi:thiamine transport system permease protein
VEIYNQTVSLFNLPLAATLSLLQLAFTLLFTSAYSRLAARLSRPLALRPARLIQKPLSPWPRRLAAAGVLLPLSLLLTLPLIALLLRSFTRLEAADGGWRTALTLEHYRQLSVNRRDSLFFAPPAASAAISLGYAAATVLLGLSLGLPAAWALSRGGQSRLNRLLDPLLLLPLGTSSVTLGLGFILALDQPPLDLRASPLLPPLAHTLVAFPFVIRSLTPVLNSLNPRLRQAAAVLGASPFQGLRFVEAPLIGRALLTAGVFAFTISLGEFGATALIARPEYPTLPIAIYRFLGRPGAANYGQALALSAVLMAITAAGMLLIERFRIGEKQEF